MTRRQRFDRNCARLSAGMVGYALGIPAEFILSAALGPQDIARARQMAMYLAHVGFGISLARVATAFWRDRSTVAYACRLIEDQRDDVRFDGWMSVLETSLDMMSPLNGKMVTSAATWFAYYQPGAAVCSGPMATGRFTGRGI